ncbi:MAG: hypothetical protein QNJ32_29175 [Xenococcaceae cyanobacterium MO_167.B27]|nr:hypothetical protein [Xenococcaceae cyanobacterium MO_167.B27]
MKNTQRQIPQDKTKIKKLLQLQPLNLKQLDVVCGGFETGDPEGQEPIFIPPNEC